jgi:hypothetical protein
MPLPWSMPIFLPADTRHYWYCHSDDDDDSGYFQSSRMANEFPVWLVGSWTNGGVSDFNSEKINFLLRSFSKWYVKELKNQTNPKTMIFFFWVLAYLDSPGDADISEEHTLRIQPWRWRQYISPKHWYLQISLNDAKTQNIIISLTSTKTSYLIIWPDVS